MRILIKIIIICSLSVPLAGFIWSDTWDAIIYEDKSLTNFKKFSGFKSLEECRNFVNEYMSDHGIIVSGDYECGLNCDGAVCEETRR